MTLSEFIEDNREEVDKAIRHACNNCIVNNDDERKKCVLNNELLSLWAEEVGVEDI